MIWLSSSTISKLRDRLKERGQRPSVVPPDSNLDPEAARLFCAVTEYGPLCEAMYLMMSADGKVGQAEREVLRGALANLAGETVRTKDIEAMLDAAGKRVAAEGRAARLQDVAAALREDRTSAEVAFMLAAAIAFADNAIADQENETLNALADALGIDETRANALLDDMERDLEVPAPDAP